MKAALMKIVALSLLFSSVGGKLTFARFSDIAAPSFPEYIPEEREYVAKQVKILLDVSLSTT